MEALTTYYVRLDELSDFASSRTSVAQGWIHDARVPDALRDMVCEAIHFTGTCKSRHVEKPAALLVGAALLKQDKLAKQNVLRWIEAPCPATNSESDGVTPRIEHLHRASKR